jgi:hypothetical protein
VSFLDRLTAERDETGSDSTVYDLAQIRATSPRCIDLEVGDGLLAVDDRELSVSFAVFQFACGSATQNGVEVSGAKMSLVFHGEGPSGALRELRHTYWGEDGYIFYPNGELISKAFVALREWFDCD